MDINDFARDVAVANERLIDAAANLESVIHRFLKANPNANITLANNNVDPNLALIRDDYKYYPGSKIRTRYCLLSVTEVGDKLFPHKSAAFTNKLLCRLGLQTKDPAGRRFQLTDQGKNFAVQFEPRIEAIAMPTIVWSPTVIPLIQDFLNKGATA